MPTAKRPDDGDEIRVRWSRSDRRIPRLVVRPLQTFLETEASGGILLLVASIAALVWANLAGGSYESLWHTKLTIGFGDWTISEDLRHWINDAPMTLFFLVVGLEIKREIVEGELRDPRVAALPVAAAIGGMVVPALVYAALAGVPDASRGWGIPMATDIAFAVGVLALVGRGLPSSIKLFLLTLAIVDDIGAILVIAIFYSGGGSVGAMLAAAGMLGLMLALRRLGVHNRLVHFALGTAVWIAAYESGVHPTIAGVALAFIVPAGNVRTNRATGEAVSPLARLEQALHPWTSFAIVPLFALANAGVPLRGLDLGRPATARVLAGVVGGLVLGKVIGITLGAWAATRLRIARLPDGVRWPHVAGVAALGGIGFTVSLFIAGLAFGEGAILDAAKLGILGGSLLSGIAGSVVLVRLRAS